MLPKHSVVKAADRRERAGEMQKRHACTGGDDEMKKSWRVVLAWVSYMLCSNLEVEVATAVHQKAIDPVPRLVARKRYSRET
jgi:hypothetical protein